MYFYRLAANKSCSIPDIFTRIPPKEQSWLRNFQMRIDSRMRADTIYSFAAHEQWLRHA